MDIECFGCEDCALSKERQTQTRVRNHLYTSVPQAELLNFSESLSIHLEDEHTAYLAGLTMGFHESSRCVGKRLQNPGLTCRGSYTNAHFLYLSDFSDPSIFLCPPTPPCLSLPKAFFFFLNKMYAVKFLYLQADGIDTEIYEYAKVNEDQTSCFPLWGCLAYLEKRQ